MRAGLPNLRVLAIWIVAGVIAVLAAALLVTWSGLISVAATSGHWAMTERFLEFAMRSSVRTHSLGVAEPQRLDDPDLVQLGAGHYAGGCAPCHGAPGQPRSPVTLRMLPEPTALDEVVGTWQPRQLFWIVKHGLKYTAMPSWVAADRDDEVWAVVAFLATIPKQTPEQYRALARGNVDDHLLSAGEVLRTGVSVTALSACARCHGDERAPPVSRLVPRLSGQPRPYLERALHEYAAGSRSSGIMQPIAALLDSEAIAQLASYYAALPPRPGAAPSREPELIEQGRIIATAGAPRQLVPACLDCHRDGDGALFPLIEGQPAPFIAGQLRLWQRGGRAATVPGRIMAAIATRLDDRQITAVAAYLESIQSRAAAGAADSDRDVRR